MSGTIRDLAEGGWSGAVPAGQLWKPTGQAEEIAPGVIFLHTFANMTVVRTSGRPGADRHLELRGARQDVRLGPLGRPRPRLRRHLHARPRRPRARAAAVPGRGARAGLAAAAHRRPPQRRRALRRYRQTNGYNALINARQFGIPPAWPMDYDDPDMVYDDAHPLTAGEIALELHHARGETDDHTWIWWPERRILWTGDCSSGSRPTPAIRRRSSATPPSGRWRCAPCSALEPGAPDPRPRAADRRRGARPPGAGRHGRVARDARARDRRPHERRRHARHDPGRGAPARPSGRSPVSAGRLRRARVRRPQHLAALRRLVGRRRVAPQARGERRAGRRGRAPGRRRRAVWWRAPASWPRATTWRWPAT